MELLAANTVANFGAFKSHLILVGIDDHRAGSGPQRLELFFGKSHSKVSAASAASLAGMKLGFSAHAYIALHASTFFQRRGIKPGPWPS
jgi:hypothetical protein